MKTHTYIRIYALPALLLVALCLPACEDDDNPCNLSDVGENYLLSDTALALMDPYLGAQRIVFNHSAAGEVALSVGTLRASVSTYSYGVPCPPTSSFIQTIQGLTERQDIALSQASVFPEPVYINVFETPLPDSSSSREVLSVSLGELFVDPFEPGDELFYYNIHGANDHLQYYDSLSMDGRWFYDVYELADPPPPAPRFQIRYTLTEGIVYIRDTETGDTYTYLRIE